MPKTKKLTEKVKAKIKKFKGRVKQSDYTGEALLYLKKYRSLQKARKVKSGAVFQIGGLKVAKNTDLYRTIEASAKAKGQTVKQFVKDNEAAILKLAKNGSITINRETDYVIKDIQNLPKHNEVFVFDVPTERIDVIYALQRLQMVSSNHSYIVLITYDVKYDLKGNMYLNIPMPNKYDSILDDLEELEDDTESSDESNEVWTDYLDEYPIIHYIVSNK